ncbi:hypothetical protein BDY17DRAFT_327976 [Neohortaea acidophila]|uniref:Uncharacterized protein n=1 Tax=Neohortaea acidophila TaxID=245834 RepID=A0A6A6PH00_9PEZI|nr:uncharacterized protein BDY17DRAFT_327976 [Neohortaea acidophila]KAF2479195.1 hypothetical protein BDY17DRAFT_327976 [Neohortaea acidophila]
MQEDLQNEPPGPAGHSPIPRSPITEHGHQLPASADDQDEENAIVLDPANSERRYHRDLCKNGVQREVWRPGDGDGAKAADYFDKPGPVPPLEQRWRFYQSKTGNGPIKQGANEPPKFVILDDRAVHDLIESDLPRAHLSKWWPHDFANQGKIRVKRPHRGRGAIGDPDAEGDDKYYFEKHGTKDEKYYFTGEPGYRPIVYISSEPEPPAPSEQDIQQQLEARKRKVQGHNQYTPLDQLVKYGALGLGHSPRPTKRINAFLRRDPSPQRPFDKARLFGQAPQHAAVQLPKPRVQRRDFHNRHHIPSDEDEEDGMWVLPDDPVARKKRKRDMEYQMVDPTAPEDDLISSSRNTSVERLESTGADTSQHLRHKVRAQRPDFFAQLLATQIEDSVARDSPLDGAIQNALPLKADSGSYAVQLEAELEGAKKRIAEQDAQIAELKRLRDQAEDKITALEEEILMWTGGFTEMTTGHEHTEAHLADGEKYDEW